MSYNQFLNINILWIALAVITFVILLRLTAPYGRHSSIKWGPLLPNHIGWIIMEAPVLMVFLYFTFSNGKPGSSVAYVMVLLFILHYIYRSFIFPFRIKTIGKKMPLLIAISAICFNTMNGFLLGTDLACFSDYGPDYLVHWNFILGIVLFVAGFIIHSSSDAHLISLRNPGETGYKIPYSFWFKKVSCPNFLGEIIQWSGFALLCWNISSLSFLIWTLANLIPRAIAHHRWYHEQFADYPVDRKAIFPFLL